MGKKIKLILEIPGKDVKILGLPDYKCGLQFMKLVEEICSNEKIMVLYSKLEFVCIDFDEDVRNKHPMAWVILDRKRLQVFVNWYLIKVNLETSHGRRDISGTIIHEITHVFQFENIPQAQQSLNQEHRLRDKLKLKKLKDYSLKRTGMEVTKALRIQLKLFQERLWWEGCAKFNEIYLNPKTEVLSSFLGNLEGVVQSKMDDFLESWRVFKSNSHDLEFLRGAHKLLSGISEGIKDKEDTLRFLRFLTIVDYDFGLYMVSFILRYDKSTSLTDIYHMGSHRFIKHYEVISMSTGGKMPLISLTSGAGRWDIKKFNRELLEMYKEYKRM
jgi:hypothetical protein